MQKEQLSKATKTVYTILRQMAMLIPREFVKDAAEANRVSNCHNENATSDTTLATAPQSHA